MANLMKSVCLAAMMMLVGNSLLADEPSSAAVVQTMNPPANATLQLGSADSQVQLVAQRGRNRGGYWHRPYNSYRYRDYYRPRPYRPRTYYYYAPSPYYYYGSPYYGYGYGYGGWGGVRVTPWGIWWY